MKPVFTHFPMKHGTPYISFDGELVASVSECDRYAFDPTSRIYTPVDFFTPDAIRLGQLFRSLEEAELARRFVLFSAIEETIAEIDQLESEGGQEWPEWAIHSCFFGSREDLVRTMQEVWGGMSLATVGTEQIRNYFGCSCDHK